MKSSPMRYMVLYSAMLVVGSFGAWATAAREQSVSTKDSKYLLQKQPKAAKEVLAVRNDAKDQQDVVVVGRIGGRQNPWVKSVAAFSIVDRSLTPCNEIPGDVCKTPWDYCCEPNLAKSTLLVMVQDDDGKIVKKDARSLLGVEELDTIFVQGKAKRDKSGNVTILASKMYVVPDDEKEPSQ